MKNNHISKKIFGFIIGAVFVFGISAAGRNTVSAEEPAASPVPTGSEISTGGVVQPTDSEISTGGAIQPTDSPVPIDTSKIKLSRKKAVIMAKKKVALTVSGTVSPVTWSSQNEKVATVSKKGVVKGVAKGKTVINASVDGIVLNFNVTVVPKMSKKDFGKFSGENFVASCQRKDYDSGTGWAWDGQWKSDSKKKKTYRGIKVGASKTKVKNAYGEFTLNPCKKSDLFAKTKGLKMNKVKTYCDMIYGKYRIRFYFNKKNKVVAILLICNIKNIKKKDLKKYY